jgi:D-alanyl-lipoteichoic acid acyltransferase DltB (MBOAT superfamily)
MLFNSFTFQLLFLPAVIFGSWAVRLAWPAASIWLLTAASLVFYGWHSPHLLALLGVSIGFNFLLGKSIYRGRSGRSLAFGIAVNLCALAYFKYYNWFAAGLGSTLFPVREIVLPLAISFFTFEQISYLVDCQKRRIEPATFSEYAFFVSFFPKLIAGPIVRFSEIQPQMKLLAQPLSPLEVAAGLAMFVLGLCKKVVFADQAASFADPVFQSAANGMLVPTSQAWLAALAYSFQIYFDFSGYTDMALGLALIFGLRLPLNFSSPYKSLNITDFWRRWHMTLSRFLRDYLYIPLGGNRLGATRTNVNLMIVMLLGGLWHGAGIAFVVWGGLHGLYLIGNHAFRRWGPRLEGVMADAIAWILTFGSVVLAWVFFRSGSLSASWIILGSMAGFIDPAAAAPALYPAIEATVTVTGLLLICLLMPNTAELIGFPKITSTEGVARNDWHWRPNIAWGLAIGVGASASILFRHALTPFIYFRF